jgi:hypothetical protein
MSCEQAVASAAGPSGSCYGPAGQNLGDWTAGYLAAKRILTPSDIRRKAEPEYRAGWNKLQRLTPGTTSA